METTVKTQGILKSVSNTVKELNTEKRTQFRTCVVEINGKDYPAKIWEKSFQNGVTIGNTYTIECQEDGELVWLTVLNGTQLNLATKADLAHLFANITV